MGLLSAGSASLGRLLAFGAAVTLAFDRDGLRVMQQAVQRRGGQGGIAGKDARPVLEGDVGRQQD
jgi:hypothetical protein